MTDIVFFEELDGSAPWYLYVVSGLGITAGAFCGGALGVGGVVVVPLLDLIGIGTDAAIGSTLFAMCFSIFPKIYLWHRAGKIMWRTGTEFAVPAIPGAILGTFLVTVMPAEVLRLAVSLLCIASSAKILREMYVAYTAANAPPGSTPPSNASPLHPPPAEELAPLKDRPCSPNGNECPDPTLQPLQLQCEEDSPLGDGDDDPEALCLGSDTGSAGEVPSEAPAKRDQGLMGTGARWVACRGVLGFITGLFSAVTGTGGNIMLVPLFFAVWPDTDPHMLVGSLLPLVWSLTSTATVSALLFGHMDLGLSLIVWFLMIVFSTIGAKYGLLISAEKLKRFLVVLLLLTGFASLILLCLDVFGPSEAGDDGSSQNATGIPDP